MLQTVTHGCVALMSRIVRSATAFCGLQLESCCLPEGTVTDRIRAGAMEPVGDAAEIARLMGLPSWWKMSSHRPDRAGTAPSGRRTGRAGHGPRRPSREVHAVVALDLVASSEAATSASHARGEQARSPRCARPARSATALGQRRLGNGTVSQPAAPPARRAYAPRRRPGIDGRRRLGRPHHRPSKGRRRGVILIARSSCGARVPS